MHDPGLFCQGGRVFVPAVQGTVLVKCGLKTLGTLGPMHCLHHLLRFSTIQKFPLVHYPPWESTPFANHLS